MNDEVLNTLETRLTAMFPEKTSLLEGSDPGQVRFDAFGLDSLDTLQFAMDIEEALNIDIEAVHFSNGATLADLAQSLADMVKQQRS